MKILMIIDGLNVGGAERRMISLVQKLHEMQMSHTEIIVLSGKVQFKTELERYNIRLHIIERKPKKDPRVFFKVFRICQNFKPDIIHAWGSMSAIYAIPVRIFSRTRFINGMIVNAPTKAPFNELLRARISFLFSDFIISNSQAGIQVYAPPLHKTKCIPNGFNFDRLNDISDASVILHELNIKTTYVVGMVGRLDNDKDFNSFIDAAIEILKKRRDVTFLVVGGGSLFDQILKSVPEELKTFILLTGERSDVESIINIFDIGVLFSNPYLREGISNVILEYMALGKPVIATEGGGTNEIITDSHTGFLIPENNTLQIVEKITFLLDNPLVRKTIGDHGNQLIMSKFNIDLMVNTYLELYQAALS